MDKFKTFKLEGFDDIDVFQPGIRYYIDLIQGHRYFAFLKQNHGLWDGLVDFMEIESRIRESRGKRNWFKRMENYFSKNNGFVNEREKAFIKLEEKGIGKYHFVGGFMDEIISQFQNPIQNDYYFEAISFRGFSNSAPPDEGGARHTAERMREAVLRFCPIQPLWHDGLIWKDAIMTGELDSLFEIIRGLKVVIVGPQHLSSLGKILKIKDFNHVSIHPTAAIKDRFQILDRVKQIAKINDVPKVFLFQAGAFSYWLIYRLFKDAPQAFYLDMGLALDIWFPDKVSIQPWFIKNKDIIIANMKLGGIYK